MSTHSSRPNQEGIIFYFLPVAAALFNSQARQSVSPLTINRTVSNARAKTVLGWSRFNAIFHDTPNHWLVQKRLDETYFLLSQKDKKPCDIYLGLGFEALSHFSYAFKLKFGLTPTELIQQGKLAATKEDPAYTGCPTCLCLPERVEGSVPACL